MDTFNIVIIIVVAVVMAIILSACCNSYRSRGRVLSPPAQPNANVYVMETSAAHTVYPVTTQGYSDTPQATPYIHMPQPMQPPAFGWQAPYPPGPSDAPPSYSEVQRSPAPTQLMPEPYPKQQPHNPNY